MLKEVHDDANYSVKAHRISYVALIKGVQCQENPTIIIIIIIILV